jgi:replicative DNA helicase
MEIPQSLNYERELIGCLLVDPGCWTAVEPIIAGPNDFHDVRHRRIWTAIRQLVEKEEPIHTAGVTAQLSISLKDKDESSAMASYVREVALDASSAANAIHFASKVRDYGLRREALQSAERLMNAAGELAVSNEELCEMAAKIRDRLDTEAGKRSLVSLQGMTPTFLKNTTKHINPKAFPPVAFSPLAKKMGGRWWPGLHVVIGQTKSGKSQLVLQQAIHAARHGFTVVYLSLELSPFDVMGRLLSDATNQGGATSGIPWRDISTGKAESSAVEAALGQLDDILPRFFVYYGDALAMGPEDIKRLIRQALTKAEDGRLLVVVDYLQAIGGAGELRERVRSAALALSAFANRHQVPVITVSSLSRDGAKRIEDNNSPKAELFMTLGKESGEIEYSAVSVIGIDHHHKSTEMEVAVAGGRMVESGWAKGLVYREGNWWVKL